MPVNAIESYSMYTKSCIVCFVLVYYIGISTGESVFVMLCCCCPHCLLLKNKVELSFLISCSSSALYCFGSFNVTKQEIIAQTHTSTYKHKHTHRHTNIHKGTHTDLTQKHITACVQRMCKPIYILLVL